MYEKRIKGWRKHIDFILLDIACVQLAFVLAYIIRFNSGNAYADEEYKNFAILYVLADFLIAVMFDSFKNVLRRGFYQEFTATVRHVCLVEGVALLYLFSTQSGVAYSRLFFYTMIPLYLVLSYFVRSLWKSQQVGQIGDYTVLTSSLNVATSTQLHLKRLMDIVGGLAGCIITLLLVIIVGPLIYISSPGPIFFSQERVGRNAKQFKMYKFRTMYPDAEARKAELMAQNRVEDGMMFKLDFDPRIIGNRRLPDGTIKEGLGNDEQVVEMSVGVIENERVCILEGALKGMDYA